MKQVSFSQAEYAGKKKVTRRDTFLAQMEAVIPWARLIGVIDPVYPQGKRGRPPIGLDRMLRMYFVQQWYTLADEALEDAIYDSHALQRFIGIDLAVESVPDATTLLKFRRLLEKYQLTRDLLKEINKHLEEKKLLLRQGTLVDATLIAAAPSTKNRDKSRDSEMHHRTTSGGFAAAGWTQVAAGAQGIRFGVAQYVDFGGESQSHGRLRLAPGNTCNTAIKKRGLHCGEYCGPKALRLT